MRFKLRQMEIFRAVMTCGSVSAAAKALHVSQPAVSRSLAYTEQKLGLTLFLRVPGKLSPTAEAERLLSAVDHVYQSALKVNELALELATSTKGMVRLISSPCLSENVIPMTIARFAVIEPDVKISYKTGMSTDMPFEILSDRCDVAVSALPVSHPGLQSKLISRRYMVCLLPAGHPLGSLPSISLEALAATPYISYLADSPFGQLVAREFEHLGLAFRPQVAVERSQEACALVKAGVAPALVDEFVTLGLERTGLIVRPLSTRIAVDLWVVTPRHELPSVQSRTFIELLERTLDTSCSASSCSPIQVSEKPVRQAPGARTGASRSPAETPLQQKATAPPATARQSAGRPTASLSHQTRKVG